MKVTLDSGNTMILEAPATLKLDTTTHVQLASGRLYCDLKAAETFVIETPRRSIRDIGTQVGVEATQQRDLVQVYDGKVVVGTKKGGDEIEVATMDAVEIDAEGEMLQLPFSAKRFVRDMPPADAG